MGNTIHQLGIQLVADTAAVLLRACCGCLRIAALVNRCVSGHRKLDQLICFADTVGYLALNDFLSVETIHRNLCVGCNDDAVRIGDFLCSQHVFAPPEPRVSTFTKHPFAFAAFSIPSAAM